MSADEFDEWLTNNSPKLSSFPLHTHEWRLAFLLELYMQGYPALLEGVSHAWALMERPKAARCTYVGLLAGTGGKGKKALYNLFHAMIREALAVYEPIPRIDGYPSLDAWNDAVHRQWAAQGRAVDQVILKYALLLVGRVPDEGVGCGGDVIKGPWRHLPELPITPCSLPREPARSGSHGRATTGRSRTSQAPRCS